MIVLRGATSQSKRSRLDSLPIGPAPSPPAQMMEMLREVPPHRVEVHGRIEHAHARLVELDARLEEILLLAPHDDAGIDELLALDARHDADHRIVIRALSVHGCLLEKCARRLQAAREMLNVGVARRAGVAKARVGGEPGVRNQRDDAADDVGRDARGHRGVRLGERAREFQQHVILDAPRTDSLDCVGAVAPAMMEVQRGTVIDQPQPPVPHEHVGVARRAVHVADVGVEPDDGRGQQRRRADPRSGSKVTEPGR